MGVNTQIAYSHMTIQEMSAVRSPFGQENFHIFNKDCEKHFRNMSAVQKAPHDNTKLAYFSETNNTPKGIVCTAYKKSLFYHEAEEDFIQSNRCLYAQDYNI